MRVLVLQLKRIGDLILTTPALSALRRAKPEVEITLMVADGCAGLLPAISGLHEGLGYRRNAANAALWGRALSGGFDACLDFTGTDRSAFFTGLSRASDRVAFSWVNKSRIRALAYNQLVDSTVRDLHTVDHYLQLLRGLGIEASDVAPSLNLPATAREAATGLGIESPFALIHPGTARPEKYWLSDRWSEVIAHLKSRGLRSIITSGPDADEQAHAAAIAGAPVITPPDLLTLSALVERAALVISCDTAVVHLGAAFQRPQIALFGPTNPFHWRPRHPRAVVVSASKPAGPLREFTPRMKGAPMDRISTTPVFDAINTLVPNLN